MNFNPDEVMTFFSKADTYSSAPRDLSWFEKCFPNLVFYPRMLKCIWGAAQLAKAGKFDDDMFAEYSLRMMDILESVGVTFQIDNISRIRNLSSACVFVANHMSMLETFVLPGIIIPSRRVTFVIKESLLEYPVFKHVMRSRDPITVSRTNPREDFRAVMDGGSSRLERGISLIIFPQTTRTSTLDPRMFNTIGIKLARREQVPVIPIALKTDAWATGWPIKDMGKIDPEKKVHFYFGDPITITGSGKKEHEDIIRFIDEKFALWRSSQ
jgi:1-acyl-sn-glycerol-3-phosphate acyltransferase